LPGTKRLVNEFDIKSVVGSGTTVTVTHWKNGR
jgi:serine/threonine-protein kinase RsbT